MKITLNPGDRIRIEGMDGGFTFDRLVVRPEGVPMAVVCDNKGIHREVPVDRLRPLRKGRRRSKVAV